MNISALVKVHNQCLQQGAKAHATVAAFIIGLATEQEMYMALKAEGMTERDVYSVTQCVLYRAGQVA